MKQLYAALFILLLPCNVCKAQSLKRDDSAMNNVNFVKNPFQKLMAFILSSSEVFKLSECVFKCLLTKNCYSLNLGEAEADGRHLCELLSGDMFRETDKLVANGDFHHYNIKTPCMKVPCQNGGTCFPIYDRDDYTCVCVPEYTGRHCEKKKQIIKTIIICEEEKKKISCSDGGKIDVVFANFGRLDDHTCPHDQHDYQSQTACSASTSLDRVQTHCQDKPNCLLTSTRAFFSEDPCPGIFKYLLVKYQCELKK